MDAATKRNCPRPDCTYRGESTDNLAHHLEEVHGLKEIPTRGPRIRPPPGRPRGRYDARDEAFLESLNLARGELGYAQIEAALLLDLVRRRRWQAEMIEAAMAGHVLVDLVDEDLVFYETASRTRDDEEIDEEAGGVVPA